MHTALPRTDQTGKTELIYSTTNNNITSVSSLQNTGWCVKEFKWIKCLMLLFCT